MTIAPAQTKPGDKIEDVTIPDSPAALEEMLGNWKDTSALAKAGLLPQAIEKYGRVCVEKDVEIQRQVQEGVQAGLITSTDLIGRTLSHYRITAAITRGLVPLRAGEMDRPAFVDRTRPTQLASSVRSACAL